MGKVLQVRLNGSKSIQNAHGQFWDLRHLDRAPIRLRPVLDVEVSLIISLNKPYNLCARIPAM